MPPMRSGNCPFTPDSVVPMTTCTIDYSSLTRDEAAVVLRVYRQSLLYPMPRDAVQEWMAEELAKYRDDLVKA